MYCYLSRWLFFCPLPPVRVCALLALRCLNTHWWCCLRRCARSAAAATAAALATLFCAAVAAYHDSLVMCVTWLADMLLLLPSWVSSSSSSFLFSCLGPSPSSLGWTWEKRPGWTRPDQRCWKPITILKLPSAQLLCLCFPIVVDGCSLLLLLPYMVSVVRCCRSPAATHTQTGKKGTWNTTNYYSQLAWVLEQRHSSLFFQPLLSFMSVCSWNCGRKPDIWKRKTEEARPSDQRHAGTCNTAVWTLLLLWLYKHKAQSGSSSSRKCSYSWLASLSGWWQKGRRGRGTKFSILIGCWYLVTLVTTVTRERKLPPPTKYCSRRRLYVCSMFVYVCV